MLIMHNSLKPKFWCNEYDTNNTFTKTTIDIILYIIKIFYMNNNEFDYNNSILIYIIMSFFYFNTAKLHLPQR